MARWNALKHGVLSKGDMLPTEDKAQDQELLEQLREDRGPQDVLQEIFVEKAPVYLWRQRRLLRYDFGNNQGDNPRLVAARQACVNAENRTMKLAAIQQEVDENGSTNDLTAASEPGGEPGTITHQPGAPPRNCATIITKITL